MRTHGVAELEETGASGGGREEGDVGGVGFGGGTGGHGLEVIGGLVGGEGEGEGFEEDGAAEGFADGGVGGVDLVGEEGSPEEGGGHCEGGSE